MLLKDLLPSNQLKTITVLGNDISARGLTGLEQAFIDGAIARPEVPLRPDPNKGSLAPKIPAPDDPVFRIAEEQWFARHQLAHIVVATEKPEPMTTFGDTERSWLLAQVDALVTMDTHFRKTLYQQVRMLGLPSSPESIGAAEKN